MKLPLKNAPDRWTGNAMIAVTILLLLLPGPSCVLCIAPGGHVEVEDIGAACCSHFTQGFRGEQKPENGYASAGDCQNCIDLFFEADSRPAVLASSKTITAHSPADANVKNRLQANMASLPYWSAVLKRMDAPIPISSPTPLRC